jgi:predicted nucleic acid-binding protein
VGLVDLVSGQRVYLDANIFIYALEGHARYADVLAELFDAIDHGEVQAVTSELTLAEVLVKPFADANAERQAAYQRVLRSAGSCTIAPIDRPVLIEAARLRAATALRLPDAIHVATARLAGCRTFISNDRRLRADVGLDIVVLGEVV